MSGYRRAAFALEPDWALQDPDDYLRVLKTTIPQVLKDAGVVADDVIGVGIDFTACTMLPVTADGRPLCTLPEWRRVPHAWVKLWKHHAAQPEADRINQVAREAGQAWLDRYGGRISSEWFFSKALQILNEAPRGLRRSGSVDGGGGLGRLAADGGGDSQLVYCGLQGALVETGGVSAQGVLRQPSPTIRRRHR